MERDAFLILQRSVGVYDEVIRLARSGDEEARWMILGFEESLEEFLKAEYEDLKSHMRFLHPNANESDLVKACASAFSEFIGSLKEIYGRIYRAKSALAQAV